MEIKAPDGTTIYRGNGKETTAFTVNIRESGIYPIVVEGRHAKGTIHVQLEAVGRDPEMKLVKMELIYGNSQTTQISKRG